MRTLLRTLLSIGLIFILGGTGLMPQPTLSEKWWVTIIGVIVLSYALDAMTKRKAKK